MVIRLLCNDLYLVEIYEAGHRAEKGRVVGKDRLAVLLKAASLPVGGWMIWTARADKTDSYLDVLPNM